MQTGTSKKLGRPPTVLNDGDIIVLYKKGSRGLVLGEYSSIQDMVEEERRFYQPFSYTSICNCVQGRQKSYLSYAHQCRVIAKIKRVSQTA